MIAITDTSAYAGVEFLETQVLILPTVAEINLLIGSTDFVNASITTAFKNLLGQISTGIINSGVPISKFFIFFNRIGFYNTGTLQFSVNDGALDAGTEIIINELHKFTEFKDIAHNSFYGNNLNNWAQDANNIRAMENSGLQKLHYITVYSNSNANTSFHNNHLPNEVNILNLRNESTERFLMINLDANADPEMPNVRIFNNSDVQLLFRIKVEYSNYVNPDYEGGTAGAFGLAVPNDNNLDGTIEANEKVNLNRRFLDYFPNQDNAQDIEDTIYTRVIDSQAFWDVDFDDRIRGGEVTVEFFPEPENVNSWSEGDHHYFIFYIRGKNPTYLQVQNYLNDQNYLNRFWFVIRKLRHESGSIRNFNGNNPTNNNYEFRHFDRVTNINQYNHRKNSDSGLPVFGFPRGYGISQLDNFSRLYRNISDIPLDGNGNQTLPDTESIEGLNLENYFLEILVGGDKELQTIIDQQDRTIDFSRRIVASDQEVWHWKENIDKAVWFLENEKMNITINKITTIRNRVIAWNNAHPTDLVEVPTPEYYNSVIYCWTASDITEFNNYNDLFNQGTPPDIVNQGTRELNSFFDAMLLKSYNGNTGGYFMDINRTSSNPIVKPILSINPTSPYNPYYVRNLSNRSD